jgi:hypothetical protein
LNLPTLRVKKIIIQDCSRISCHSYMNAISKVESCNTNTINLPVYYYNNIQRVKDICVNFKVDYLIDKIAPQKNSNIYTRNSWNELITNLYSENKLKSNTSIFNGQKTSSKKPLLVQLGLGNFFPQAIVMGILSGKKTMVIKDKRNYQQLQYHTLASSWFISVDSNFNSEDFNLFSGLLNQKDSPSWGLFYPYNDEVRELVMLKAFLYPYLEFSDFIGYNLYYPLNNSSLKYNSDKLNIFVGAKHEPKKITETLVKKSAYTYALPHSNGIDLSLGNVFLCPKKLKSNPVLAGKKLNDVSSYDYKSMPCFNGADCSRTQNDELLVDFYSVNSTVVFLYTCYGFLMKGGIYDIETSLSYSMALSPSNFALLTTTSLALLDSASGIFIGDKLEENYSLGIANKAYNSLHFENYEDTPGSVLLLGDPEMTLQEKTSGSINEIKNKSEFHILFKAITANSKIDHYKNQKELQEFPEFIGSDVFANIEFTRALINSSIRLPIISLKQCLIKLMQKNEELWILALILIKRREQNTLNHLTYQHYKDYHCRLISELHKLHHNFFSTMCQNLGGLFKLQLDKVYEVNQSKFKQGKLLDKCNVCKKNVSYSKTYRIGKNNSKSRRTRECLNCGITNEGCYYHLEVSFFITPHYEEFQLKNLRVEMSLLFEQPITAVSSSFNIEPFNKKSDSKFISIYENSFDHDNGNLSVELNISSEDLNIKYNGVYYLNACLVVNDYVFYLRAQIYI